MKDFILEISFHPDLEEIIQGRLFLTRSMGSASTQEGALSAYFEDSADREAAADLLRELPVALALIECERLDWLQLYQQSLHPMLIGESFVVAPEASLIPAGTRRCALVIPQEQAFGTGSHESTALSIELLETFNLRGKRGLDIGSGSGILALAMLLLGAKKVIAFDIDLDAFRPLRENRRRNEVSAERMPLFIGSTTTLRGGRFEVITMNILPEVIAPLLPQVKEYLAGDLILSGILAVLRSEVVAECVRNGLGLVTEREKGEWWAGHFVVASA